MRDKDLKDLGFIKKGNNWHTPDGRETTRAEAVEIVKGIQEMTDQRLSPKKPKKMEEPTTSPERTQLAGGILCALLGNNELLTAILAYNPDPAEAQKSLCRQARDYADTLLEVLAE